MRRSIVTTVIVVRDSIHERVRVWNRGGLAGVLVVSAGDGDEIARRLLPDAIIVKDPVTEERRYVAAEEHVS